MKIKIIYLLLITIVFYACKENPVTEKVTAQKKQQGIHQLTNSNFSSEGAFLFATERETLLSWTEISEEKNENLLKFAFFNPNTNVFSKPITVATSKGLQTHQESMAKVAITKEGTLYALFRIKARNSKSMYGGTLYYSVSTDKGITWSDKTKLVTDAKSTSQSFYDVAQLANGELGLVWLDNRKLHKNLDGQTLYFAKTNGNKGFQNEVALEGSVCQCCRTEIEVDANNNIHIGFRNLIEPKEIGYPGFLKQSDTEIRDMYYITSKNNGASFSKAVPISNDYWQVNGCPHTGPALATTKNTTGAIWFTGAKNEARLYFTTQKENVFNERILVSKEGKHPQMIALNDKFYMVYEVYYETDGKGYSKIILEERNATQLLKSTEISAPKSDNNHAVLKAIDKEKVVISWVNNDIRKSVIHYLVYN